MLRNKLIATIIIPSMMVLNLTPAFAVDNFTGKGIGGVKTELPVYQLPELDPIEMPSLSKNYENMESEMIDLGFGDYRFKHGLPLPDVEAPVGTGNNAADTFTETFGDLWSDPSRQLNKESTLPINEVLNAAAAFSMQAQTSFSTIKAQDSAILATMLAKKLDTSKNWNMSEIKASLPRLSEDAIKTYLAGTEKPENYGKAPEPITVDQKFSQTQNVAASLGIEYNGEGEGIMAGSEGKALEAGVAAREGLIDGFKTFFSTLDPAKSLSVFLGIEEDDSE